MRIEDAIPVDLLDRFEFHNYNHALEILTQAFPEEWNELLECLNKLNITVQDLRDAGGNETNIPKKFDEVLYPYGWREIKITGDFAHTVLPEKSRAKRPLF